MNLAAQNFERLFNRALCAQDGCDRRPARGSRFCAAHLSDRREGRVTIWHGGPLLPDRPELTKGAARQAACERSVVH